MTATKMYKAAVLTGLFLAVFFLSTPSVHAQEAARAKYQAACDRCITQAAEANRLAKELAALEARLPAARLLPKQLLEQPDHPLFKANPNLDQNGSQAAQEAGGETLVRELQTANDIVSKAETDLRLLVYDINRARRNLQAALNALDACNRLCGGEGEEPQTENRLGETVETYDAESMLLLDDDHQRTENRWVNITTNCPDCKGMVDAYNEIMSDVVWLRGFIERLIRQQEFAVQGHRKEGQGRGGLITAGATLYFMNETSKVIDAFRAQLETKQKIANEHAVVIRTCEKQCVDGQTDDGGIAIGGTEADLLTLPFPWDGPYSTDCWYCEKLVAELNRLPGLARERLIDIAELRADLEVTEALFSLYRARSGMIEDFIEDFWADEHWQDVLRVEGFEQAIEETKGQILQKQLELERIKEQFHTVLGMLQDCEQLPQCTAVYLDPLVQLQQTLNILGFNGFNVSDAQNINTAGPVVVPQQPATTTDTPPPSTGTPPGSTPQTPASTPLSISTDGNFNFTHSVGPSPCPTDAGVARVSSNNGNPLRISDVSVSGDIADVLDVSIEDNNTANPGIRARFNCRSNARRSYSGQVTATVTDTVTGESQSITIPASGQVN